MAQDCYIQEKINSEDIQMDTWEMSRPVTCCFTGHRPQHFSFKYNENHKDCVNIKEKLVFEIEKAINAGYKIFISGGAIGVDMWAAQAVIELKGKHNDIRLELAIPCINQSDKWNAHFRQRYTFIFENADEICYTSKKVYTKGCMKARNEFMVNRSTRLIAVYNGKRGGTKQTISMAEKKGIEIYCIQV